MLAALDGLAREMGLVQAVGEQSRAQRLALFLIYARLAHQGSRLSAARWSEDHSSLKQAQGLLTKYRLHGWVKVEFVPA